MKRIIALVLVAVLSLSVFGCAPAIDADKEINIMVLNGTTGFGAAKLMDDASKGTSALKYNFSVETDASAVTTALISGSTDIAALPTNAAAAVYNKSKGAVKVAAANTLGVLYIADSTGEIKSFADLKGKTLYVPGQGSNPEYIVEYLCQKNGLAVGSDITLDFSYNAPADLRTAAVSGKAPIAVLPEPMMTIAKSANTAINVAVDLTAEWDRVSDGGKLVQGCIVVSAKFAESNPRELDKFLEEYSQSVSYVKDNADTASVMISEQGIFEKATVAAKAIPNCNLCYISGAEMKTALSGFYQVLFDANTASIGGKMPGDDFYYKA